MTKHKDLHKAILQMADGSKSAFHTFYLGSAQFVYSSARLLCGDHKAACRFMVDFYQYLYLHLPEYKPSQDLEKWISRLIMERFSQLSIGRKKEKPSVQKQMGAGAAVLETTERERVWRLLEERMHFPAEDLKKSKTGRMLLVPLLLLAVLLTFRYREEILEKIQNAIPQEVSDEQNEKNDAADGEDVKNDESEYAESPDAEAPDANDDAASLINNGDSGGAMQSPDGQTAAPKAPAVDTPSVDTPSPNTPTVDEPSVDTPTVTEPTVNSPISEQGGGQTGLQQNGLPDLENYELESYYGNSLTQ